MPRLNFNDEAGSALIEFVGLAALLMLPIMWFSIDMVAKQNDQFAATAMAEHGLRAWVQSDVADSSNFELAMQQIADDFQVTQAEIRWQVDCGEIQPCQPASQVVRLIVRVRDATATAVMRWFP